MLITNDSIKLLKHSNDSLTKVLAQHSALSVKIWEPQVQAAIIIALTTLTTVILGFIFKDFWIPGWIDKRTKQRQGQDIFNQNRNRLFKSALAFSHRLSEIYRIRSHYLWENAPQNSFYEYKYRSSVYRLCVLLGWIRAYRLEESSISIKKTDKEIHIISQALDKITSGLADGQAIEMNVAISICRISTADPNSVNEDILNSFSVEIDDLVLRYLTESKTEYISQISKEKQGTFIQDLDTLMTKLHISHIPLNTKSSEIIAATSVRVV